MVTCPLCEHSQPQGGECVVCGRELPGGEGEPAPQIPALAALELTAHPAVEGHSIEQLPELVSHVATRDVGEGPERPSGPSADGGLDPERDLDTARYEDPEPRVRPPGEDGGAVRCRYCQHVQVGGVLCAQCGVRLPRRIAAASDSAPVRCAICATPVRVGHRCTQCGLWTAPG